MQNPTGRIWRVGCWFYKQYGTLQRVIPYCIAPILITVVPGIPTAPIKIISRHFKGSLSAMTFVPRGDSPL